MRRMKTASVLLATLFCFLLISCGGGDSPEPASEAAPSEEAVENLKTTQQEEPTKESDTKAMPPKEYPSTAGTVVKQFYMEAQNGDLAGAVKRYVKDSDSVLAIVKDSRQYKWLEANMPEASLKVDDAKMQNDDYAMVRADVYVSGFTSIETHHVYLVDGKWKIDGKFLN